MMKKSMFMVPALAALLLCACGGGEPVEEGRDEARAEAGDPAGGGTSRGAAKPGGKGENGAQAPAAPPAEDRRVDLRVELPKPLFRGTPKNLRVKNLEKARKGRRPPLRVPAGVALLSRGKPVTSSEEMPLIGELSMITDGDKSGYDDTFVDLGFGTQWVQIDLEQVAEIHAILFWHYHQEGRVYHDVIVQVSRDPDFITATTLYNNDDDNSSGLGVGGDKAYVDTFEGRLVPAGGVKARYVRLYSRGNTANDQNHYVEVEVYGRPAGK